MTLGRVLLVALMSVSILVRGATAQTEKPLVSVVADLRTLDGAVQVRYPPGSEEHAASVQRFLAEAKPYFEAKTGKPLLFTVALLGPSEWLAINPPNATYANFLPGVSGDTPPIVTLPAVRGHALDAIYTRLWAGSEPPDPNRGATLVGLHELGHVILVGMGLQQQIRSGWLWEFLANYIAYVYMLETHPDDALFWNATAAAVKGRIHPNSIALEQLGISVGVDNYVWYQASLQERVGEMASTSGWAFLEAIKTLTAKDDATLLPKLEALAPGFLAWAARNHGNATPK